MQPLKFLWLNGILLLIPILVWNGIFSGRLAHPAFALDEEVAPWVLILENGLRVGVFVIPLFLPLRWDAAVHKIGWWVYGVGLLLYFASWIPLMAAPDSAWSNSVIGFTAPASTPLIWLIGIGLVGGWWPYIGLASVFTLVHVAHWTSVLRMVQ